MTLADLPVGQSATILAVEADPELLQRLYEWGLLEGEIVRMVGHAPMGDPLEIALGHTRLSLRKADAASITVSPPSEPV